MKVKEHFLYNQEGEAQASPLLPRNDIGISNLDNKNVCNITEASNFLDSATFYSNHDIKVIPVKKQDKKSKQYRDFSWGPYPPLNFSHFHLQRISALCFA